MSTEPLIGHYRVTAKVGEGGMGVVYRATDTKLNREVAIKVLPDSFGADGDRLARFAREAQVLASLNHPNIAAIYGVEEKALVLEFVEGPTLEDRIRQGAIPVGEALEIAVQVAEALEYAHERGVIHRDLKPANIKLTPEGRVKLLDFGLAKAMAGETAGQPGGTSPTMSPTLTMRATVAGVILGTAGYMAPEQASGKGVDRRADIWSFGVVLYEMLTGKMLFSGETVSHTLASVLKDPIEVGSLAAPVAIRRLLSRCLNREPRERLRDIGEARIAIREYLANPVEEKPQPIGAGSGKRGLGYWVPLALCVVFAAGMAFLASSRQTAPAAPVVRFGFDLGEALILTAPRRSSVAVSPDGTQVAYVANRRIYLRSLAELEAHEIPGTDQHGAVSNPVFLPDGKSLVFWSAKERNFKKIPLSGGAGMGFCGPVSPAASSWSDGWLVISTFGDALLRCSGNGGAPEPLAGTKVGQYQGIGQLLPGGGGLLFTRIDLQRREVRTWDHSQLIYQDLKTGQQKILGEGGSGVRLLPTGHLVYESGGVLLGVAFDGRKAETKGGPVGLVEGVAQSAGTAQFDVSANGTMVYIPGPVRERGEVKNWLAVVNRKGEMEVLKGPSGVILYPRISRDGHKVAYQSEESGEGSVWVWVMGSAAAANRLTLPGSGSNRFPMWSGDGERIAYQSDRGGDLAIWWQRADGTGVPERLTKAEAGTAHVPDSWSADGQFFSYTVQKDTTSEVWVFSMKEKQGTRLVGGKDLALGSSVISPDGKWVAYQSTGGGLSRVYVQPYPATGAAYLAPEDGDMHHPTWSADGKELLYISGPGAGGSLSFQTRPAVSFGSPVRVDRTGFTTGPPGVDRTYDVLPDGRGFLGVVADVEGSGKLVRPQIRVVVNWFEEVKKRIPVP